MVRVRDWLRRCVLLGGAVALVACELEDPSPPVGIPSADPAFFPGIGAAGGGGAPCFAGASNPAAMRGAPTATPSFGAMPVAPSPQFTAPVVRADVAPPPISGGTLLRTADATKLIAADPDRDAVYVIDVATRSLERRIALRPGDEPGRVVQDAAGRVYVVLRGAHSIAAFDFRASAEPRRAEVCDLPRGVAYDAARNKLYVVCAEGKLVRVDPNTLTADRKVELGRDLRDVVSREDGLYVSRFRSAELMRLDPETGVVAETRTPVTALESVSVTSAACAGIPVSRVVESKPEVAWRSIDVPGRGVLMLHQRAQTTDVQASAGGYGDISACGKGIVRSGITVLGRTPQRNAVSVDFMSGGLFVDVAVDPTGSLLAVANAGDWGSSAVAHVFIVPVENSTPSEASVACGAALRRLSAEGQATALAFITPELLAVQLREPAAIAFYAWPNNGAPETLDAMPPATLLDLGQPSRNDTGHALFHVATSAGVACASCHPEAGDDGHVWSFAGFGARRTQHLRGGILGTAPYFWNGALQDFTAVFEEEFLKRMAGPKLETERVDLLGRWIDAQPALRATPPDADAVARGKALFESEELRCTECHSGDQLTNNQNAFVGTGAVMQVPSLVGVSFRPPFVHNGCAPALIDRFSTCGGGEKHGHTEQLSDAQKRDLTAYLESL